MYQVDSLRVNPSQVGLEGRAHHMGYRCTANEDRQEGGGGGEGMAMRAPIEASSTWPALRSRRSNPPHRIAPHRTNNRPHKYYMKRKTTEENGGARQIFTGESSCRDFGEEENSKGKKRGKKSRN